MGTGGGLDDDLKCTWVRTQLLHASQHDPQRRLVFRPDKILYWRVRMKRSYEYSSCSLVLHIFCSNMQLVRFSYTAAAAATSEAAKQRGAKVLAEKKQVKMTDVRPDRPRTATSSRCSEMEKNPPPRADRLSPVVRAAANGCGSRPSGGIENVAPRADSAFDGARVASSTFTTPNEKRRDALRWEMRQRMANPPTF